MNVLYFFVPLSLVVMGVLIYAAIWSIRNNQYEDMDSPAHRILMDDDDPRIPCNREADEESPAPDHNDREDEPARDRHTR